MKNSLKERSSSRIYVECWVIQFEQSLSDFKFLAHLYWHEIRRITDKNRLKLKVLYSLLKSRTPALPHPNSTLSFEQKKTI